LSAVPPPWLSVQRAAEALDEMAAALVGGNYAAMLAVASTLRGVFDRFRLDLRKASGH